MKLGIITAVCHHPRLLLLDEPLSSLDPIARESTRLWCAAVTGDPYVQETPASHLRALFTNKPGARDARNKAVLDHESD